VEQALKIVNFFPISKRFDSRSNIFQCKNIVIFEASVYSGLLVRKGEVKCLDQSIQENAHPNKYAKTETGSSDGRIKKDKKTIEEPRRRLNAGILGVQQVDTERPLPPNFAAAHARPFFYSL
jgi:hypothetical protein